MGVRGSWSEAYECEVCKRTEDGPDSWCGEELPDGWSHPYVLMVCEGGSRPYTGEAPVCGECLPTVDARLAAAFKAFMGETTKTLAWEAWKAGARGWVNEAGYTFDGNDQLLTQERVCFEKWWGEQNGE